jgi:glutaredoxin 3
MATSRPFLYLKSGCPWCAEVEEYLQEHDIAYDKVDVRVDGAAMEEMKQLSGQAKAPTMRWDEEILADFGAEELDVFLRAKHIVK